MGEFPVEEMTLLAELEAFKTDVIRWATAHDAWHDAGFKIPFVHRNERPSQNEALLLCFEGPLYGFFHGGWDDLGSAEVPFFEIVRAHGMWFELTDHVTATFGYEDPARAIAHMRLQRWQWIQELMARRLLDVRSELFEHFAQSPEDMKRMGWRQFEELLDAIFKNQGFRTQLGPGGNDGGIDIRLYQNDALPELVSLVQAKRYAGPIQLQAVAALFGISVVERAKSALFVTTSRFQPRARSFALSTETRVDVPTIELADGQRVAEWCGEIAKSLNDYFAMGAVSPRVAAAEKTRLTGKIVVANHGYNIIANRFCVVEADFPREVVLRSIGSRIVAGDSQLGSEMPSDNGQIYPFGQPRFVALKSLDRGQITFWGDRNLFVEWDGEPRHFDHRD
jgi:restriction system protein